MLFLTPTVFCADIAVNGKLNTWAVTTVNTTDKDSKGSDSVGFLYVTGELNTTVNLADSIKVVFEIELNDKVSDGASMQKGKKYTGGNGSSNPATVEIDEMYLQIDQMFVDSLSLKVGHQRLEYTLRGNKRSMVINSDFTAFKEKYKFEKGFVDLFYGKKKESLTANVLSSDSEMYGVHGDFNILESLHVIGYANYAVIEIATADNSNVGTIGAGVQYFLLEKALELFGEVAIQFGEVDKKVDRSAFGADLGARWTFKEIGSIKNLFIELNLGYRSGEDTDASKTTKFWNSWAASAGTLIAEGRYASESPLFQNYVPDSYLAIRLETGAAFTEKLSSNLTFAYYDNTDETKDPYGLEIDLSTKFKYSENVIFTGHLAAFMPDDGLTSAGAKNDTVFAFALETSVLF
jgi:hypothetical protein